MQCKRVSYSHLKANWGYHQTSAEKQMFHTTSLRYSHLQYLLLELHLNVLLLASTAIKDSLLKAIHYLLYWETCPCGKRCLLQLRSRLWEYESVLTMATLLLYMWSIILIMLLTFSRPNTLHLWLQLLKRLIMNDLRYEENGFLYLCEYTIIAHSGSLFVCILEVNIWPHLVCVQSLS